MLTIGRADLDLADRDQVEQVVGTFAPHAIVNAAAMTDVDECERDPERAFAVNALGRAMARDRSGSGRRARRAHLHRLRVRRRAAAPYDEWDAVHPLSEYGRSKLAGERELAEHAGSWAVVRTSWVFGKRGSDLISWAFGAYDRGELDGVLADQVSVPTYAPDLAELLGRVRGGASPRPVPRSPADPRPGTRHELITVALRARGLDADRVVPIATADFERPARRPEFSALDNRALRLAGLPALRPWRDAVAEYVKDWPEATDAESHEARISGARIGAARAVRRMWSRAARERSERERKS